MSNFSAASVTVIVSTFILAGIVKGVTGMGLPTISMGVLGAFMPPVAAASLLLIPSFVTNVWQLVTGPSFADIPTLADDAGDRDWHHRRITAADQ